MYPFRRQNSLWYTFVYFLPVYRPRSSVPTPELYTLPTLRVWLFSASGTLSSTGNDLPTLRLPTQIGHSLYWCKRQKFKWHQLCIPYLSSLSQGSTCHYRLRLILYYHRTCRTTDPLPIWPLPNSCILHVFNQYLCYTVHCPQKSDPRPKDLTRRFTDHHSGRPCILVTFFWSIRVFSRVPWSPVLIRSGERSVLLQTVIEVVNLE